MSLVYLIALFAVCAVFFGVLVEAVVSVSRRPAWHREMHRLELVEVVDRREEQLDFVGHDRRSHGAAGSADAQTAQVPGNDSADTSQRRAA